METHPLIHLKTSWPESSSSMLVLVGAGGCMAWICYLNPPQHKDTYCLYGKKNGVWVNDLCNAAMLAQLFCLCCSSCKDWTDRKNQKLPLHTDTQKTKRKTLMQRTIFLICMNKWRRSWEDIQRCLHAGAPVVQSLVLKRVQKHKRKYLKFCYLKPLLMYWF